MSETAYEQKLRALLTLKRIGADQPGSPLGETYRQMQQWLRDNRPEPIDQEKTDD